MRWYTVKIPSHLWLVRAENVDAAVRCALRELQSQPHSETRQAKLAALWTAEVRMLGAGDDNGVLLSVPGTAPDP